MANTNLANAKTAKNDEFYTQYPDIQKEINAYLEYDPMYSEERRFCSLAMILNGVTSPNSLHKTLNYWA